MEDLVGLVLGRTQEFLQLSDVLVGLAEVERPEVFVEVVVDEVLGGSGGTLSILK